MGLTIRRKLIVVSRLVYEGLYQARDMLSRPQLSYSTVLKMIAMPVDLTTQEGHNHP
jgi:hypothetical protein